MVLTVIVAIALTVMLSFEWYVAQPLLVSMATASEGITQSGGWNTTGSAQMYVFIKLGANVGIPLAIVFIWIWVFVSAQSQDWRGEEAYYD